MILQHSVELLQQRETQKPVRGDFRTQNWVKLGKQSQQGGRGSQILPTFPNFEIGKWFL